MSVPTKQESNSLAILDNTQSIKEVIQNNLGNEKLTSSDLDNVKIPGAGSTTWEIPSIDGVEHTQEITGIIINWTTTRALFDGEYTGEHKTPLCSSDDGIRGEGKPGGFCPQCSFSQFGSAEKGGGQACKMNRHLFILRPNKILPIVITVAPGSLLNLKKFFIRLASENTSYWAVTVKLTLTKDRNLDGIEYSKINITATKDLNNSEKDTIKRLINVYTPYLGIARVNDYEEDETQTGPALLNSDQQKYIDEHYTDDEFEAVNDNLDEVIKQADDQLKNPLPVQTLSPDEFFEDILKNSPAVKTTCKEKNCIDFYHDEKANNRLGYFIKKLSIDTSVVDLERSCKQFMQAILQEPFECIYRAVHNDDWWNRIKNTIDDKKDNKKEE